MSNTPHPVTEATAPFVATTTPNIERANRLISLRAHPGFNDLFRLSLELVQIAADASADFPGWDDRQIVVLKIRHQAAKEHHHALLIDKINEAIQIGIAEGNAQSDSLPVKTAEEAVEQGDYVRQKMLEKFDQFDSRPAGSF